MPSTEYFGNLITNLGPLTTTFTAAASCETQNLAVAQSVGPGAPPVLWRSECDFPSLASNCMPSASAYDVLYNSYKDDALRTYQGWAAYYSPASICPSDWETVGVATRSAGSESTSKSGIFTEHTMSEPTTVAGLPLMLSDMLLGSLDEGENLVMCCPRNHTMDMYGACLSTVGPWEPEEHKQFSTVCNYGFLPGDSEPVTVTSFDGKTWDPPLLSWDGTWTVTGDNAYTTFKETLIPTGTQSEYQVVHSVAALALINKNGDDGDDGEDKEDKSKGEENEDESNDKDENNNSDEGANGDEGGIAPSIRALAVLPFTVVGVGLLAGMGILMPW